MHKSNILASACTVLVVQMIDVDLTPWLSDEGARHEHEDDTALGDTQLVRSNSDSSSSSTSSTSDEVVITAEAFTQQLTDGLTIEAKLVEVWECVQLCHVRCNLHLA